MDESLGACIKCVLNLNFVNHLHRAAGESIGLHDA